MLKLIVLLSLLQLCLTQQQQQQHSPLFKELKPNVLNFGFSDNPATDKPPTHPTLPPISHCLSPPDYDTTTLIK
jgi:hypothetical protein